MKLEGGCYCGAVRFSSEGDAALKGQCHCRQCQYHSGGGVNYFIAIPKAGLSYTQGKPKQFQKSGAVMPVTREFCGDCGTQILTLVEGMPDMAFLKVGVLDDPSQFAPDVAMFMVDKQPFHQIPDGIPTHERLPG